MVPSAFIVYRWIASRATGKQLVVGQCRLHEQQDVTGAVVGHRQPGPVRQPHLSAHPAMLARIPTCGERVVGGAAG